MLKNSVLSGSRTGQWPSQAFYLGFNWSLVPITGFLLDERKKLKLEIIQRKKNSINGKSQSSLGRESTLCCCFCPLLKPSFPVFSFFFANLHRRFQIQ